MEQTLQQGTDWITQLGVPSIFAFLVLREVLSFLKTRKNGESNSESRGDYLKRTEFDDHRKTVRYADTCDKVHEGIQRQFTDLKGSLDRIENLIRRNGNNQ